MRLVISRLICLCVVLILSGCGLYQSLQRYAPPGDSAGRNDLKVFDSRDLIARDHTFRRFPRVKDCIDGAYIGRHLDDVIGDAEWRRWQNDDGGYTYVFAEPYIFEAPGSYYLNIPPVSITYRNVFNLITDADNIIRRCLWDRFVR